VDEKTCREKRGNAVAAASYLQRGESPAATPAGRTQRFFERKTGRRFSPSIKPNSGFSSQNIRANTRDHPTRHRRNRGSCHGRMRLNGSAHTTLGKSDEKVRPRPFVVGFVARGSTLTSTVEAARIVGSFGSNGAGKTSALRGHLGGPHEIK